MGMTSTIAAYGGLALGLINLSLLIYKDYFRKAKPQVVVHKAMIRGINRSTCDVEIDVDLSSKGGALYIQEMAFEHSYPLFDPSPGVDRNWQKVYTATDCKGYTFLDLGVEEYQERVRALLQNPVHIPNLKLGDGQHRLLTVLDRITVGREPDGYADWPLSGWRLSITYSGGKLEVPFDFEKHPSSSDVSPLQS
jgi:hypothetical protein